MGQDIIINIGYERKHTRDIEVLHPWSSLYRSENGGSGFAAFEFFVLQN
jgi:hypothetical protein